MNKKETSEPLSKSLTIFMESLPQMSLMFLAIIHDEKGIERLLKFFYARHGLASCIYRKGFIDHTVLTEDILMMQKLSRHESDG
jgi:hypothetical protein